jgi:O-antigen ligase
VRGIQLYRRCDTLSGIVLLAMLVTSPWLFGTTQPPVIDAMNLAGYVATGLLAIKWALRHGWGYRPPVWGKPESVTGRRLVWGLGGLTLVILGYMLVSAVNARATWQPETQSFLYRKFLPWLPHSYHAQGTWQLLANYTALAGFFWALWDWLRGQTPEEERAQRRQHLARAATDQAATAHLPSRLRLLFWVLCVNGGLLALEGIVQRQSGTTKLLWLVEPRINKEASSHFGPYAYRANGAQFLNLLWPLALGFWWTLHRAQGFRAWRHHMLLLAAAVMAAGPFIATARGGALVAGGMLIAAGLFLGGSALLFPERTTRVSVRSRIATGLTLALFFGGAVLLARNFGWSELTERMTQLDAGLENREQIYETARGIARDYRWFGTGPGSFIALFPLYRSGPEEYWPAQLHHDWLETRITFGVVGFGLVLGALGVVLARWWVPGGIHGGRRLVGLLWLALLGTLVHARFDFPFQIYSILMVVLTHGAVLFTLSRRGQH